MKKVVVLGGGTFSHVACHLSLATPAFGRTARKIADLFKEDDRLGVDLVLTKMADNSSNLVTNEDVEFYIDTILHDKSIHAIVMNVALCDFRMENPSFETRLSSSVDYHTKLEGIRSKILDTIAVKRPDIRVAAFSTTHESSHEHMLAKAQRMLSRAFCVLANDVGTYTNILVYDGFTMHADRDMLLEHMVGVIADDAS